MELTDQEAESLIEHMNQDHADTLVNYARYYGGLHDVQRAEMLSFSQYEMRIQVFSPSVSCVIDVPLTKPITDAASARSILVAMAKEARMELAKEADVSIRDER